MRRKINRLSFESPPPVVPDSAAKRRPDDPLHGSSKHHPARSTCQLLWPLIGPYKWWTLLAVSLVAFHGVAISFQSLLPKFLIDDVLRDGRVLVDSAEREGVGTRLLVLLSIYLLVSLIGRMAAWHLGYRIFGRVREKVVFGLRSTFFRKVNALCLRFHNKVNSGELFSYLFGSPLVQIQDYFRIVVMHGIGAVVTLVTTLSWTGMWDPAMALVLAATVGSTFAVSCHAYLRMREVHRDFQKSEASVSGYVEDLLRGARDVKLYAMENETNRGFDDRAEFISRKSYYRDMNTHVQWMKMETVGYSAFAVLAALGVWRVLEGGIGIGQLSGYLAAFLALQQPLRMIFEMAVQYGAARASLERIDRVLTTASTTPDPVGDGVPVPRRGEIRLYAVEFEYERDQPIINNMNLAIPYGQRVAVVGPSGGGKSTLAMLLLRLYDPKSGDIFIDGKNLKSFNGSELRSRFGVVPQNPFIFQTSIRGNLCAIRPDASEDLLRKVCQIANAWEFIERLPDGLDTAVGEGGSTLSGGQRQRLAIARALLCDPGFFIFDEATSALDAVSERLVQDAMERAIGNRTAIVIAHRLATIRRCDRIIVLDAGRIVQDGSYDELSSASGLFRTLLSKQRLGPEASS